MDFGQKGKVSGTPGQEDKSVMAEIQKQIEEIKEDMSSSSQSPSNGTMQHSYLQSNERGLPMNDDKLTAKLRDEHQIDRQELDEGFKELKKRVAHLEDRQTTTRPLDTWDVPIKLLPPSAVLADVIKAVNTLIQRDQRENRIK